MPKYKATAYIRLSYTDDHSSESDSVSNQRKLIENFVERNPDIDMFKKLRHCVIAACTQFSYLLIKPLVLDRLHGNSYEISAYKEIQ